MHPVAAWPPERTSQLLSLGVSCSHSLGLYTGQLGDIAGISGPASPRTYLIQIPGLCAGPSSSSASSPFHTVLETPPDHLAGETGAQTLLLCDGRDRILTLLAVPLALPI